MRSLLIILHLFTCCVSGLALEITNHKTGSTVRYPVVLLRGTCEGELNVMEGKLNAVRSAEKFKVLVPLKLGKNQISLRDDSGVRTFELTYEPQKNLYYVRIIWLTDSSGDTSYATPSDDIPQNYEGRLRTAAQLMQTFTAERMGDLGLGKKTFRLERNPEDHEVVIHTWKGPLSIEEYYALGDTGKYWSAVYQWINKEHPDPFAKNIVLAAFTRKDPQTGKMKGHTALGGGNLGLFGSASIFTWPEELNQTHEAFSNPTFVDPSRVHNDGAGSDTYWGVASTTIGATLHEMGHTFGLPHCTDGFGIMTRGFDHFHRVFAFNDPPSRRNLRRKAFAPDQEAYFAPVSATFLQWSPWFQIDGEKEIPSMEKPTIKKEGEEYVIRSPFGIPWVGIWSGDNIHDYRILEEEPLKKEIRISQSDLVSKLDGKPLSRVSAMAGNGRYRVLPLPE